MTPPAELKLSNYNMALGRWLGALILGLPFGAGSVFMLLALVAPVLLDNPGLPDDFMGWLVVIAMPFLCYIFLIQGWQAVLWAKFSDRIRVRRIWGVQTIPWDKVAALRPGTLETSVEAKGVTVSERSYSALRIELQGGGEYTVLVGPGDITALRRLLAAQGRAELYQESPVPKA